MSRRIEELREQYSCKWLVAGGDFNTELRSATGGGAEVPRRGPAVRQRSRNRQQERRSQHLALFLERDNLSAANMWAGPRWTPAACTW